MCCASFKRGVSVPSRSTPKVEDDAASNISGRDKPRAEAEATGRPLGGRYHRESARHEPRARPFPGVGVRQRILSFDGGRHSRSRLCRADPEYSRFTFAAGPISLGLVGRPRAVSECGQEHHSCNCQYSQPPVQAPVVTPHARRPESESTAAQGAQRVPGEAAGAPGSVSGPSPPAKLVNGQPHLSQHRHESRVVANPVERDKPVVQPKNMVAFA